MLAELDPEALEALSASAADLPVSDRLAVAEALTGPSGNLTVSASLLASCLQERSQPQEVQAVRRELALVLIGLGQCEQAMGMISPDRSLLLKTENIQDVFNYAMAEWGATERLPVDLFDRALVIAKPSPRGFTSANYYQCLAVAAWAAKDQARADSMLQGAEAAARSWAQEEFSCWRYRRASPVQFLDDCRSIRRLLDGEDIRPAFFRDGRVANIASPNQAR
jgi:hypothetical protein